MKERGVARPTLATVVTGENDEGVFGDTLSVELGEDFAHAAVNAFEHGLVDGAAAVEHRLLGDKRRAGRVGWLERPVHGEVRHVQKRMRRVIADKFHGAFIDEIGEVAVAFHGLQAFAEGGRAVVIFVLVVVGVAEELAEIFVEAAFGGVVVVAVAEVPFAKRARGVARRLEAIGDGGLTEGRPRPWMSGSGTHAPLTRRDCSTW